MIDANRKLFPWKCVQGSKVPKKWLSLCGQLILTIDNHIKRNMWSLVNWCCMCKHDVEFVDHLPLSVSNCLWFLVIFYFYFSFGLGLGVHWVLLYKVIDVLSCWKGPHERHSNSNVSCVAVASHCVMWLLWSERNGWTLKGGEIYGWS